MNDLKELRKLICEAIQKTNHSCSGIMQSKCNYKGCCAHCGVIAEYLLNNNVEVHNENNK